MTSIRLRGLVIAALTLLAPAAQRAAAQTTASESAPLPDYSVQPYVTLRLHAGPNVNLMRDWRQGVDTLADMADAHGLAPHGRCCRSKSWGATVLVHITDRVAIGGTYEALRDTREFLVTDTLDAFGIHRDVEYSFENETEVAAKQAVVAVYPHIGSHTHVQFGGGIGTGHTQLLTPGSRSYARLHAPMLSISVGTEARFWYVDAGWRYLRMRATERSDSDFDIAEARDLFPDTAAVTDFVRDRSSDLTGVWARIGIAIHVGHR